MRLRTWMWLYWTSYAVLTAGGAVWAAGGDSLAAKAGYVALMLGAGFCLSLVVAVRIK